MTERKESVKMTLDEMAQYLTKLAAKAKNEDEKVKLAVIAGVLTMLAEQIKNNRF